SVRGRRRFGTAAPLESGIWFTIRPRLKLKWTRKLMRSGPMANCWRASRRRFCRWLNDTSCSEPRPPGSGGLRLSMRAFRVGIAGPVGSGKTALVDRLSRKLSPKLNLAVVTNDIYTKEDAEFLIRRGALPADRVIGVETGGCPHAAIRE